ncbi:hypothetical protein HD554DRAFT_2171479 [Boletus coccyginus]|nr:hypothetical protein HD554DRAFT_2171479 [Boletus coccyginus]
MSLTPFKDILMLGKAPSADPAKSDTIKEVVELKIQLDGMSQLVPDDQDDLAEDQEMWCARWQKLLNQVHTSFQCAKEHSVDTALEADLLTQMQGANALSCQWLGAAEQTPVAEQAVGSAAPGLVQESADKPPTTKSPSEEHESMSSADQKQKHVSSWVVVDEEENDRDDIIKVMAPKPSKAQTGLKTVCTPLRAIHASEMKCEKSKGKAGKAKKDMALIVGPKAKGKEKVQPRPGKSSASKPVSPL